MDVADARALAEHLLAEALPKRWDHVRGVATRAEQFIGRVADWNVLAAAAYLHDIGYAPEANEIGFHQIDGARYLRSHGWDEAVVNLVAHHSAAELRAGFRGLAEIYAAEFPLDPSLPHRELHFCDLTTSVSGQPISLDERLINMRRRHRADQPMIAFLDLHEGKLRDLVDTVNHELGRPPLRVD